MVKLTAWIGMAVFGGLTFTATLDAQVRPANQQPKKTTTTTTTRAPAVQPYRANYPSYLNSNNNSNSTQVKLLPRFVNGQYDASGTMPAGVLSQQYQANNSGSSLYGNPSYGFNNFGGGSPYGSPFGGSQFGGSPYGSPFGGGAFPIANSYGSGYGSPFGSPFGTPYGTGINPFGNPLASFNGPGNFGAGYSGSFNNPYLMNTQFNPFQNRPLPFGGNVVGAGNGFFPPVGLPFGG